MMTKEINKFYYLHCCIGILFMFFFQYIPAPAPITHFGMQMLGIFLGLIYMWSFVNTLWPSVLGLFALCFTEYGTSAQVVAASFGNSTSVLLFFFLALVVVIEESNLAQYFSNCFLSIKLFHKRPWLFTLCWFLVVAVMASCCNMFLIAFTFWSIFY